MGGGKKGSLDPMDLLYGGVLQCAEAATFGMPFEVWKTHMGTFRNEGNLESFRNIYKKGGVTAFWKGWQPKMVESFLKGGLLIFAKDGIIRSSKAAGFSEVTAGLLGGFGGGCAQVVVLGPCTYLITAKVAERAGEAMSMTARIKTTWEAAGIAGFYRGGFALMLRQGSNWASRQGLTDAVRAAFKARHSGEKNPRLSIAEEAISGTIGGALSVWNQPFEVLRIEAQSAAARGLAKKNIVETARQIFAESGFLGFYQGSGPRAGLCIVQTQFMITIPYILAGLKSKD